MTRSVRAQRTAHPELLLLGPVELRAAGIKVELPTRKLLAIIAFLALEGESSRATLAALLWEASEDRARANLRGELYRLRGTAFAGVLEDDGKRLRLAHSVQSDLERFDRFLAHGDWVRALELRRGPLLEGFEVSDAPAFEDWLLLMRERWQERWNEALAVHASQLMGKQDWNAARAAYERLLELDPWREEAVRGVMRAFAQSGEATRSLERFERFALAVREQLGVEPASETLMLAEELRHARAVIPARQAGALVGHANGVLVGHANGVLVGREQAWAQLEAAWNAGKLAFIVGEPGVGKTRLALEFAASKGAYRLIECGPSDATAPYALFTRYLRNSLHTSLEQITPWIRLELARLVPEYAPAQDMPADASAPLERKVRLFEAVTQFFLSGIQGSSGLVLDNAQFFDPTSFELSNHLSSRANQALPPIRSILTFRRGELQPEVQARFDACVRSGEAAVINLEPLALEAVQTLIEHDGHALNVERVYRATGGNPFFVLETLRVWQESGATLGPDSPLPRSPRVGELLRSRLEALDKTARALLRAIAIAGPSFTLIVAARALGTDALALTEANEVLERTGLVRGGRFAHDLMLEAVLEDMPLPTRVLLHTRVLDALEASPRERGQAAELLRHARAIPDATRALKWAERAANEALEQFAFQEARTFFLEALAWHSRLEADVLRETHLRLGLEEAQHQLGEREAQTQALTRLTTIKLEDAALRHEVQYRQGRLAESLGQHQEAVRHYAQSGLQKAKLREVYSLEKLGSLEDARRKAELVFAHPDGPDEAFQAALLLAELAFEGWEKGRADTWFNRAEALLLENPTRKLRLLRAKMRRAYHVGTLEESLALASDGEALALELGASHEALTFSNTHALTLMRLQRLSEAIEVLERVRTQSERLVATAQYFGSSGNLRFIYTRIGAFEQSMALLPELAAYAKRHDLSADLAGTELITGLTHAYAGRGPQARASFEQMLHALTPSADFYFRASVLHGLALACTLEEDFSQAETHALAELEITRQRSDPDWVTGQSVLAFAIARQGRFEEACELSDAALEALREDRLELPSEPIPWINAQIHHALGHNKQARASLERAQTILERSSEQLPETYRDQYLEAFCFNREIRKAIKGRWPKMISLL
jgi:DNA-binding SARP family transcriptional activator